MPHAALEAVLDPASDAAVREVWRVLDEAGLPSQAKHRSPTNAPHVTLVSAPVIDEHAVALGAARIVPLLPLELPVSACVALGDGPRYAVALLCAPPAAAVAAVEEVASAVGDEWAGAWVAHVTLALRMSAAEVGAALEVLEDTGARPTEVRLVEVRHWDPAARTVTPVRLLRSTAG
jgi:hypothetical protein